MKKFLAAALAVLPVLAFAGPAHAATRPISITEIVNNSPGPDTGSNTSLNTEWVVLTNTSRTTVQLKGWTVNERGWPGDVVFSKSYTFGSYALKPGHDVYVHTGRGVNGKPDANDRYQQLREYFWSNDGAIATLRDPNNTILQTCRYGRTATSTTC